MKRLFTILMMAILAVAVVSCDKDPEVDPGTENPPVVTYSVGDVYNDGVHRGVVFEVSEDGLTGKIVAFVDAEQKLLWNEAKAWCKELGEGWRLPSVDEATTLYNALSVVNNTLASTTDASPLLLDWYWTADKATNDEVVWTFNMETGQSAYWDMYNGYGNTRAIRNFGVGNEEPAPEPTPEDAIVFADSEVKRLCVENWDTNKDGELSYAEAAAVTDLGDVFYFDKSIKSFDELQYFTSLKTIGQASFYWCEKLTSITLPNSVTNIGDNAFCYCESLTSITIPNSVTNIGDYAFRCCYSMTSITIPDSVESIGRNICGECRNLSAIYGKFASDDNRCLIVDGVLNSVATAGLTEFVIPYGVTEISAYTFYNLTNFTSITIPESVSKINVYAFENCSSLTSITIPDSVESIGKSICRGCRNLSAIYGKFASDDNRCLIVDGVLNSVAPAGLTEYVIPSEVTEISECTFYEFTNFTSITIPESVSKINNYAFWGCSSLTSVYCKPTTPPAGDAAMFASNASDRKIYVPTASVEAYKSAEYWSDYADAIVGAGGEVVPPAPTGPQTQFTSSQGAGGTVVLRFYTSSKPEGVEGAELTKSEIDNFDTVHTYTLTDSTFALLGDIERIVIEDETITAIDTSLNPALKILDCQNNKGLTSLDLSSNANLTNLKAQNCGLTSLLVSNEAEDISNINLLNNNISGAAMTAFVESLPTVSLLGYIYLSNDANGNIAADSDLKIAAFKNFDIYYQGAWVTKRDLSIDFADSEVKRLCVENWDTDGNGELTCKEAAAVTDLGDVFFDNDIIASFNELQYFTALKTIGEKSFCYCVNLTSITLPKSVTNIGNDAFGRCYSMTSITIPDRVESIGRSICGGCHNLSAIYGKFATDDNRCLIVDGVLNSVAPAGLTEFVIPSGVTEIGQHTFAYLTNFTSITIPESVSKINDFAFWSCTSLTSVYCKPTTPPAGGPEMFHINAEDRKIYVPTASVEAYKKADYWSDYADAIVGYDF